MRAAVPEKLGNLDLVGASDRGLCGREAVIVPIFLELPRASRGSCVGLSKDDSLFLGFRFGGGFLNDLECFLHNLGFCNRLFRGAYGRLFSCNRCWFVSAACREQQSRAN